MGANIVSVLILKVLYAHLTQVRAVAFVMALGIYAVFSSPTPDAPGWAEAVIGLLLVFVVGVSGVVRVFDFDVHAPFFVSVGQILLVFGLSVGVVSGVVQGHELSAIARDVFPFLFMMMPVLLLRRVEEEPGFFRWVLSGVFIVGAVFSLRAVADIGGSVLSVFLRMQAGELAYFANAPTVLFSALMIFGLGVQYFTRRFSGRFFERSALVFVLRSVAAVALLIPVAMTVQRASLGYVAVYVVIVLGIAFVKRPYAAVVMVGTLVLAALPLMGVFAGVVETAVQKSDLVGFNRRFDELAAVWEAISGSPLQVLFGLGWGGTFESPAVAEFRVGYTHSLLSSMVLKTGIVGLVLGVGYIGGLLALLWRMMRGRAVFVLALLGPVLIDVFLYASFKSLDFGLILLLIPAGAIYYESLSDEGASLR